MYCWVYVSGPYCRIGTKKLVQSIPCSKPDGAAAQDPVHPGHCLCLCCNPDAVEVPFIESMAPKYCSPPGDVCCSFSFVDDWAPVAHFFTCPLLGACR